MMTNTNNMTAAATNLNAPMMTLTADYIDLLVSRCTSTAPWQIRGMFTNYADVLLASTVVARGLLTRDHNAAAEVAIVSFGPDGYVKTDVKTAAATTW